MNFWVTEVVTAGDLGITAQEVEQNLSQAGHPRSPWAENGKIYRIT